MSDEMHCGECDSFSFCVDDVEDGDWDGSGACLYEPCFVFMSTDPLVSLRTMEVNKKDRCHYKV